MVRHGQRTARSCSSRRTPEACRADCGLHVGIQAVLDVRANPVSRKYGFARKSLSEIGAKLGFNYHHLPELGIAGTKRAHLTDSDSYQRLLEQYEAEMLPKRLAAVTRLLALLRERPSALVCFEKDMRYCHRGRLAAVVARAGGLEVLHL